MNSPNTLAKGLSLAFLIQLLAFVPAKADPLITNEPQSRTNVVGTTATFSVVASGTGLTYQWRRDSLDLDNSGNISGATSSTMTVSNVQDDDMGYYSVVVDSSSGFTTSANAKLTVITPPSIFDLFSEGFEVAGAEAQFQVGVDGTTPYFYQWKKNGSALTNGGRFSGVNSYRLIITGVGGADAGNYSVTVTNAAGLIESDFTSLEVWDPYINVQPAHQGIVDGGTINLHVTASGTALTYQWRTNDVNIPGATKSSYTKANAQTVDAADYTVIVNSAYGSETSIVATVTVDSLVRIYTHPAKASKIVGQPATFTVGATGDNLAYQWKIGPADISSATNIPGATSSAFTIDPVDDSYVGSNRVYVTVSNDNSTSNSLGAPFVVVADTNAPAKPLSFLPATTAVKSYTNNLPGMLSINGKATDNARVENVYIKVNGADPVPVTLNNHGTNVLWSTNITTVPGTNTLEVYSVDYSGRQSPSTTATFLMNQWSPASAPPTPVMINL